MRERVNFRWSHGSMVLNRQLCTNTNFLKFLVKMLQNPDDSVFDLLPCYFNGDDLEDMMELIQQGNFIIDPKISIGFRLKPNGISFKCMKLEDDCRFAIPIDRSDYDRLAEVLMDLDSYDRVPCTEVFLQYSIINT